MHAPYILEENQLTYVSRLSLTILAAAGITLFSGALFYLGFVPGPNPDAATPGTVPQTKTYVDPMHLFSFQYPEDGHIDTVSNDDSDVVFLTRADQILEIHITPSDSTTLTASDIREDAGDALVAGVTRSLLAARIPLLQADIAISDLGPIPHAWFLRHGYRYQLMVNQRARPLLDQVLTSWCFQDEPIPVGQLCAGKPTP
jgi:hypothetical protein